MLVDANENAWERRWFVLRRYVLRLALDGACFVDHIRSHRPHLHMYARSSELDEVGVISLSGSGVKVEYSPDMEALFDVGLLSPELLCVDHADGVWCFAIPVLAQIYIHIIHRIQLACPRRTKRERAPVVDHQDRPDADPSCPDMNWACWRSIPIDKS